MTQPIKDKAEFVVFSTPDDYRGESTQVLNSILKAFDIWGRSRMLRWEKENVVVALCWHMSKGYGVYGPVLMSKNSPPSGPPVNLDYLVRAARGLVEGISLPESCDRVIDAEGARVSH